MTDSIQAAPLPQRPPRLWPHLLLALLLTLAWVVLLELWIRPRILAPGRGSGPVRIAIFVIPPLFLAGLLYLGRNLAHRRREARLRAEMARGQEEAKAEQDQLRRETEAALERDRFPLEVLGLSFRIGLLSEEDGILPQPPPRTDSSAAEGHSEALDEVLEATLGTFPGGSPLPVFLLCEPDAEPGAAGVRLRSSWGAAGLSGIPFSLESLQQASSGPESLQLIHAFFETHAEVPAALLVQEGAHPAAFLLGRRDRARALRNHEGDPSAFPPGSPMQPFWVQDQRTRKDRVFTPTPYIPEPWSREQVQAFLDLCPLGHLHRSQAVLYEGGADGPRHRAEQWSTALEKAIRALPEGQRFERVIYHAGPPSQGRRIVPPSLALERSDPGFDLFDRGTDLHPALASLEAPLPLHALALALHHLRATPEATALLSVGEEGGWMAPLSAPPSEATQAIG